MAILAIISTAFENAVYEDFQRLAGVENAGTFMSRGNANRSAFPWNYRIPPARTRVLLPHRPHPEYPTGFFA